MSLTLDSNGQMTAADPQPLEPTPVGIPQSDSFDMSKAFGVNPWDAEEEAYQKSVQEWRKTSRQKIDQAALDPESYYKDQDLSWAKTPQEGQIQATNDAFLNLDNDGEPIDPSPLGRHLAMAVSAERNFGGRGAESEEAFHAEIVKDAQRRDRTRIAIEMVTGQAATSAALALTKPSNPRADWAIIRDEVRKMPGYSEELDADLHEVYYQAESAARAAIAPYKDEVTELWKSWQDASGAGKFVGIAAGLVNDGLDYDGQTKAAIDQKSTRRTAFEIYDKLKPEERDGFMQAIAVMASGVPKEEHPKFFANIAKQSGRDIETLAQNAKTNIVDLVLDPRGWDTSAQVDGPTEYRRKADFVQKLQNIREGQFDPVKKVSDGWWGQLGETMAYGTAGALTTSLMASNPYSAVVLFSSLKESHYQSLLQAQTEAGINYKDASDFAGQASFFGAALETGSEMLGSHLLRGQLPFFDKALTGVMDRIKNPILRGATRFVAGGTESGLQEIGQNYIDVGVREIAAAFGHDTGEIIMPNAQENIEAFAMVMPLALMGIPGAAGRDARVKVFAGATDLQMAAAGYSVESTQQIRAGIAKGLDSGAAAIDAQERMPESPEAVAAQAELNRQIEAQRLAMERAATLGFAFPKIIARPDGMFAVHDGETGEEIARGKNLTEVQQIISSHTAALDNMRADHIAEMGTMLLSGQILAKATGDENVFDLGKLYTLSEAAATSPQAAERIAEELKLHEEAGGGTGEMTLHVLGQHTSEIRDGLRQDVNTIFAGGHLGTLLEETIHGKWRAARAKGLISREEDIALLRAFDEVLSKRKDSESVRFIPEGMADADVTDVRIEEAIGQLAQMEIFRTAKDGKNKFNLPRAVVSAHIGAVGQITGQKTAFKLKSFMEALRARMGIVMSRVAAMKQAEKNGEFDRGNYDAYLAKLMGVDQQDEHDTAVRQQAGELLGIPEGDPFSIGQAIPTRIGNSSVTANGSTQVFNGTDGSTVIGPAAFSIGAFHGTPHDVDQFSLDKIGTGEGAQAYGWGLYFAKAKAVAKGYMKAGRSLGVIKDSDGKWWVTDGPKAINGPFDSSKEAQQLADSPSGNLYTVELNVDQGELIDWEKPLAEQSEFVKAAIASIKIDQPLWEETKARTDLDGRNLVKFLAAAFPDKEFSPDGIGSQERASRVLHGVGIQGIRYFDGNSRNRPIQEIKEQFLSVLPEDAEIEDVKTAIGDGSFTSDQERFLSALEADDWLGFEYPAQAISAALSDKIRNWEPSQELLASIEPLRGDVSHNYVMFDDSKIKITEANGNPVNLSEPAFSIGRSFPVSLADSIVAHDLGATANHPDYTAAKGGDSVAALRLAKDLVTPEIIEKVRASIGGRKPLIVPVLAIEESGRNRIPLAVAKALGKSLWLDVDAEIIQSVRAYRGGKTGLDRIFSQPTFDGQVKAGQSYFLVDDTLTQGGTFAALADHIRSSGGEVIGSLALTGKQYSAKLNLSEDLLDQLRAKFSDVEDDFRRATGYGFDYLTESEARTLVKFKPANTVRDRIIAEGDARGGGMDGSGTGEAGLSAFSIGNAAHSLIEKTFQEVDAGGTGKGLDEVLPAMHSLFDGTFKQLFNKAEAEVSRSNTRRNAENSAKLIDIASSGRRAGAYSNPLRGGGESTGEVLGGNGLSQGSFAFSIGSFHESLLDRIGGDELRLEQPKVSYEDKRQLIFDFSASIIGQEEGGETQAPSRRDAGRLASVQVLRQRLAQGIAVNLEVRFLGETIQSQDDLATKAMALRNPMFETFYLLAMKPRTKRHKGGPGHQVVKAMAVTSRVPCCAQVFEGGKTFVNGMEDHVEFLRNAGATHYVLIHNHPSGDPTPSGADLRITMRHAQEMENRGFKLLDHIVINHETYSSIDSYGVVNSKIKLKNATGAADGFAPQASWNLEDIQISSPDEIVNLAQALELSKAENDAIVGIMVNAKLKVVATMVGKESDFLSLTPQEIQDFGRGQGGTHLFLHAKASDRKAAEAILKRFQPMNQKFMVSEMVIEASGDNLQPMNISGVESGMFTYPDANQGQRFFGGENAQGERIQEGSPAFSLGNARLSDLMAGDALARVKDPIRRAQAMSKISKSFNALRIEAERFELLAGAKRTKKSLAKEAAMREAQRTQELEMIAYGNHYGILSNDDLVKLKSQPGHEYLSDPDSNLRGRLMSKSAALKKHPNMFQLHRAGDYDGSDGISRSVFGGQLMPDQAAQEMYDNNLISEPTPDAMWELLIKEQNMVAKMKEAMKGALADIKQARITAREETNAWLATQTVAQENNYSPKQEVLRALRSLDAILMALPPEIRGRIGGYTAIAQLGSDETRLAYLRDKLAKADNELERWMKTQYDKEFRDLLKRTRPQKDEAGQKPLGKIGADVHDLFRSVEASMTMTGPEVEAEVFRLESLASNVATTAKDEAHLTLQAGLVSLAGNWANADAARREAALLEATRIFFSGYQMRTIELSRQRERLRNSRDSLQQDTGKAGTAAERDQKILDDNNLKGGWKNIVLGLGSFEQAVHYVFGSKSAEGTRLVDLERAAAYAKSDAMQAKFDALDDLFLQLAGSRYKAEKLAWEMSQKTISWAGRTLSPMEAITATLMWRQEDGKRHMLGHVDENGNPNGSWRYEQKDMDQLETLLSNEAKAIRAHFIDEYSREYDRINAVFVQLYGVNMPRHKFYSPLTVAPVSAAAGQVSDPLTGFGMSSGSMTPGSLRTRSQDAIAEPLFKDAHQVFIAHAKQMEHFIAYGAFGKEALALVNSRDVGNSMEAKAGDQGMKVIRNWIEDFATGGTRDAGSHLALNQGLNRMAGRAASAILVGRAGVLAIQSTQLGAALAEMPTASYLKRLGALMTGNLGWRQALASPYIQRRLAEMPVVVRLAMDGLKASEPNQLKHAVAKLGRLIGGADALFTAGSYAMIYDYQLGQAKNLGLSGAAASAYAHQAAERATDRIAQPTRVGARSLFENRAAAIMKLSWAFASEARQKLGLTAFTLASKDASMGDKARAVAVTWLVGGMIATLIRTAWKDARDGDDDDLLDAKNWDAKRLALSTLTGPLQGLPILGDLIQGAIYKATGTYSIEGNIFSSVGQAAQAVGRVPDWFDGTRDADGVFKDVEALLSGFAVSNDTVSAAASISHLARDLYGVAKSVVGQ